ncbi:MAG: hypothetical protein EOR10_03195 [Mesorhizobium sp.]|nr:MAG: hypothetical protein EOR10_03195 [Mesorhizobium sp.]
MMNIPSPAADEARGLVAGSPSPLVGEGGRAKLGRMRGVPAWHHPRSFQHPSTVLALRANPPSPTRGEGKTGLRFDDCHGPGCFSRATAGANQANAPFDASIEPSG